MSETVPCEQVVLGWSTNSLLGGDGFGPVFASAGWRLPVGDRDAGLGVRARFLDQGAAALVDDGAVPPRCLTYERTEQGSLLISKAYAVGAARPGQYVVHALLDPSGRLGPRELFECAERGLLRTEQPVGEADAGWPLVEVPVRDPDDPPSLDRTAEAVLSMLLERLADRRPMVLASRDAERAEHVVRQVVGVLPDRLAGGLSLATFASDPAGEGLRLSVTVPPFSRPGPVDVDLDAGVPAPSGSAAAVVAALTAAGLPAEPLTDDGEAAARLAVVPASLAKGLEFDAVVVVDPAAIAAAEPRGLHRLYVVLTRAVSTLVVLHRGDLPEPLAA
jgi:hypothetical protein